MQNAFYTISHHHFLWIMHNTSSKAKHIRDSLASVWIRPPLPSVALQLQGIDLSDCSWFSPALFIQDAVSYILPLIHIECSILGQHLTEATRMTWHVGGYSLTVGTFILVAALDRSLSLLFNRLITWHVQLLYFALAFDFDELDSLDRCDQVAGRAGHSKREISITSHNFKIRQRLQWVDFIGRHTESDPRDPGGVSDQAVMYPRNHVIRCKTDSSVPERHCPHPSPTLRRSVTLACQGFTCCQQFIDLFSWNLQEELSSIGRCYCCCISLPCLVPLSQVFGGPSRCIFWLAHDNITLLDICMSSWYSSTKYKPLG
ncbi:hypothetical protein AN0284.2 [Aspergillus nidulans FGSC A4]|uniref:Uncharacterized protein n=1 Tax=Emericella nidulans (strain FGSC A4 / ATCC 38163 / CBS 112.46 / NRRL 194 / M139) TaxID=227321 RepID=Q5BGP6_EMENI|nr:hypothetical protein [Aspergillus nidulans FGSC A4]EAA66157.1 hypothetical protein AN0284.2 [Aspergillus nidulans FGSC A4]CBF89812.1 TPA: hypothetical protein ANIA_00284 [Aspergillus nidulans FGSC A4]|eukprot:XP_657888.1 hypothetical protein AN0284.2 [Aspergillus nidulans FGSC A4]